MTAVSGDLLTIWNATIDDLVGLLRDQQARKVDVVPPPRRHGPEAGAGEAVSLVAGLPG